MPPSSLQPPIQRPSNPHLLPKSAPEELVSPVFTPTLMALYVFSEPDSPPLRNSPPTPHTLKQLRSMLWDARWQLAVYENGPPTSPLPDNDGTDGEDHEPEQGETDEYHRPLWSRPKRPPVEYFRAFASSEEMRMLEELEAAEAELLARKVARQEEELAWLRREAERGIDEDDEEQMEEGDWVDEAEAGSSDIQEVVVKVMAEVLEDDEGKEQQEATSSFFEPTAIATAAATATANRSVLPFRATVAEFGAANVYQRSIVRLNRPPPLTLKRETPLSVEGPLVREGFWVAEGQTVAESWGIHPPEEDLFALIKRDVAQGHQSGSPTLIHASETAEYLRVNWTLATPFRPPVADPSCLDHVGQPEKGIFPIIWQYVVGGHQSGSLHLTDERTGAKEYLRLNWTLATPYRGCFAGNLVGGLSSADDADTYSCDHLSLDHTRSEEVDSRSSPDSCEPGLAIRTRNPPSTADDTSQVCQRDNLGDESLAQRGLRQWKMAQAAFMHRHPVDLMPSAPLQHIGLNDRALAGQSFPNLAPRSESLAQRGLQQAQAAQAAFERPRERDPSMTLPLNYFIGDDEILTQQGFQQWNAAQTAFLQSYQCVGPSASGHQTLTPGSEELARRGREQWWAAQTAYHRRMRTDQYRLQDTMNPLTSTVAVVDVPSSQLPG